MLSCLVGIVLAFIVRLGGVEDGVVIGVHWLSVGVEDVEQFPDVVLKIRPDLLAMFVPEVKIDAGPFTVDFLEFLQVVDGIPGVSAEVELGQQFTGLIMVKTAFQFFNQVFVLWMKAGPPEPEDVLQQQGGEGDDDQYDEKGVTVVPGRNGETDKDGGVEVVEADAGDGIPCWEYFHVLGFLVILDRLIIKVI